MEIYSTLIISGNLRIIKRIEKDKYPIIVVSPGALYQQKYTDQKELTRL
jgi:hypothetical protein